MSTRAIAPIALPVGSTGMWNVCSDWLTRRRVLLHALRRARATTRDVARARCVVEVLGLNLDQVGKQCYRVDVEFIGDPEPLCDAPPTPPRVDAGRASVASSPLRERRAARSLSDPVVQRAPRTDWSSLSMPACAKARSGPLSSTQRTVADTVESACP